MRNLREWIHRLWGTLRPGRRDADLEQELRVHVEMAAEDARRRGLDAGDAVRAARIEAGGATATMEALRDQGGLPWLNNLARDARYGLRTLRRDPGFTAAAVVSLALGIGASAGIFSLLDQVLLRQLPVREPERLVQMDWNGSSISAEWGFGHLLSYPFCRDLEAQVAFFEGVFCRHPTALNFSTGQGHDQVRAEIVSGSYFHVLDVRPSLGRLIDP